MAVLTVIRIQRCENEEKIRFRNCAHKYIHHTHKHLPVYLVLALYTSDEWVGGTQICTLRPSRSFPLLPQPQACFLSAQSWTEKHFYYLCAVFRNKANGMHNTHTYTQTDTHQTHPPALVQRKLIFRKHYSFNLLNKPANLTDCLAGEEGREKSTKRATANFIYMQSW